MTGRRELLALIGAAGLLSTSRIASALPDARKARVVRRYIASEFGQIHLRIASPGNGEASDPPLILLHQTALSGRMFDRFLPHVATTRLVVALDTPGYGESDRPAERPTLDGYSRAISQSVVATFGRRFDVLGYHTGAAIAANMAAQCSTVERCVLVSVPFFSEERRSAVIEQIGEPEDPVSDYEQDGSHLLPLWQGSYGARAEGQSLDDVARLVAEKQRAGRFGGWALLSALEADLLAVLGRITKPALVIAPHDGLQEASGAAARAIVGAKLIEISGHAYGLFDAVPDVLAGHINPFLAR